MRGNAGGRKSDALGLVSFITEHVTFTAHVQTERHLPNTGWWR
jgi:hypothetical protein